MIEVCGSLVFDLERGRKQGMENGRERTGPVVLENTKI